MKNIYITTAIPYVNGAPHLGHTEDYLLADFYAKYQEQKGNKVRFQAGTDEHGNKIEKKAEKLGVDVKKYVDENSAKFKDFIDKLDVHPTDFIRTTDPNHIKRVQEIWKMLEPHIYSNIYEGWYCEGCERFITEKEYEEKHEVCPDHNTEYQHLSESNYYFRISDFKDQIKHAIEADEMKIIREFRKNEMLKLLVDSPDVSISRPKEHVSWGVEVPGDESQVMYVWPDALANYLTVLGYPDQDVSDYWPAAVQVVGKDILRFHAIIWPAMLICLGLPLPKVLFSHGLILANGQKMSKSIGNVVDPFDVLNKHGIDALRYYFARHMDAFTDPDFTWERYEEAYNNELANDYGNLVQRLSNLCNKNNVDKVFLIKQEVISENGFKFEIDGEFDHLMDNFLLTDAANYAWNKIQAVNKRIEDTKPWSVAKENQDEAKELLASIVSDLLIANSLLKPFLPVANHVEEIFTSGEIVPPKVPLFPKN